MTHFLQDYPPAEPDTVRTDISQDDQQKDAEAWTN